MDKHEEKKVLDKKFDVLNVINKTYADSSEYDLNDTLIYLSKVINQTKLKNKDLVKTNFSKFVECRIVLEEILEDMKLKGLDKDFSSEIFTNIKYVKSKFIPIMNEDDLNRERKLMIVNKYKTLFNLKNLLEGNFDNSERFVEIYLEGKELYEEVKKSKVMQDIWNSIKETRIGFLEKLYSEIIDDRNNFMEILYISELYFQVSEDKTDRKIMNTLLVNFKEKCLDVPFNNKGIYLKEINYYFLKTLIHLDKELQKELIIYLFEKIKMIFSRSSFEFINVWMHKYRSLLPDNVDLEVKGVFYTNLKVLKKKIISHFLDTGDLYESYKKVSNLLENDEIYLLNNKVLELVETESKDLKFEESADIEKYFKELDKLDIFFKGELEEYKEIKKNILNRALRNKIKDLSSFMINNKNKHKKLMEIVKIIDRLPDYYEILLKGIMPVLENDKCILYFVRNILKMDQPDLNSQQEIEIQSLIPQFGFLIN